MRISVPTFIFFQFILSCTAFAQDVHWPGGRAIDAALQRSEAGYSLTVGYMRDISYNTFFRIKAYGEAGKMYKLDYRDVGIEGSVYYTPFFISNFLQFNIGSGIVVGYDQIKGLPKEAQKKIGVFVGVKGAGELEGFLNEKLSCFVQAEQTYMVKKSLGKERFQAGVGLRFYLNNFYW